MPKKKSNELYIVVTKKNSKDLHRLRKQMKLKADDKLSQNALEKIKLIPVGKHFIYKDNKILLTKLLKDRVHNILKKL